jgi:hypothetical protein
MISVSFQNCTPSRFFHGGGCNCGRGVSSSCGCNSTYYCDQEGEIVQLLQYLRDIANPGMHHKATSDRVRLARTIRNDRAEWEQLSETA